MVNGYSFNEYSSQIVSSDLLWEKIGNYDILKKGIREFSVKFYFRNAGYGVFPAKSKMEEETVPMAGDSIMISLSFLHNVRLGESVKRRIRSFYLITDSAIDDNKISREIETYMNRLHLDLSYKIPRFQENH
jgi:hypothetical protein